MKKQLFLFMLFLIAYTSQAGLIQHQIDQIPAHQFVKKSVFISKTVTPELNQNLKRYVSAFDLVTVKQETLNIIAKEKPQALEMSLPIDGVWETLLLTKSNTIDDHTQFSKRDKNGKSFITYISGAYYHGVIKNKVNSIVAISFFENDIIGVAGTNLGNYVIGKSNIHDFTSHEYIVYNDQNYLLPNNLGCATNEAQIFNPYQNETSEALTETISTNCVKVYIECDYEFYLDHGSDTTMAINFATGIFNLTNGLYLNDSISTGISEVSVWTISDPYILLTSTSDMLNDFGLAMAGGFNGDLAHLFSNRNLGGGIAWVDVLCFTPQYEVAVSASLGNSLTPLPTYSWNANVVTHEMGHNLGSKHTHACAWNGNNTRIDNCGGHAGYTSGTCADILPDPPAGGTIMSYCHLVSVGVNFNLGFGPQPGDLVRSKVNSATCLTPCINCQTDITVSNIYSTTLTESDTWIKTSGQTTILSTASIRFDADPINGYILMQPSSTTDFFLSQPNSSNFFVAQPLDGCAGSQPARQANLIQTNEDEISLSKFDLFPNPANSKITIQKIGLNEAALHYEIYSIEGKIRLSQRDIRFSNKAEIDISMLNTGIYFIKIINGNQIEMIKFTKE